MAVVGGTASVLGGGKFASGAMAGAFIYLFNDMKSTLINKTRDAAVGFGVKKELEKIGVNHSMSNVLKQGATGMIGGAFAGTAYMGFPVGTASGAILGTAGGLTTGAAMESFGLNGAIENGLGNTLEALGDLGNGAINTYYFLRCGYGGCK